jgi:hypothetical protein
LKLTNPARLLAVALVAYVVLDVLLTPPGHLETRPVSGVTGLGLVTLGLLFLGLALAVISLVLLFRSSRRAPAASIVAAVLILPAVLAEQTGHFSRYRPPAAIEAIELVQVVVALVVLGFAIAISRTSSRTR